jgi:hypothetical protein
MTRNQELPCVGRFRFCRPIVLLAATVAIIASQAAPAESAIESRVILKSYFQTGDFPTQSQFADMIDSALNFSEDRDLLGLRNYSDGQAMLVAEGALLGPLLDYSPSTGLAPEWAGQSGFLGLAFTENSETHYGYLQLRAGDPGGTELYPLFVTYFVFEDLPNTELLVTSVPEPSTLVLGAICGLLGLWKFARRRAA